MAKKSGKYDNATASDLARITREMGLQKPNVITLREWADWLVDQENKAAAPVSGVVEEVGYSGFSEYSDNSVAQLKALATQRGVDLQGLTRKDDIIAALEAADSDEQDEDDAE